MKAETRMQNFTPLKSTFPSSCLAKSNPASEAPCKIDFSQTRYNKELELFLF